MSWDSIIPPDLTLQLQDTLVSVISGVVLVLAAGVIAFLGWLLATLLARAAQFVLSRTGVDASAQKLAAPGEPRRPELHPSRIVGFALFWTIFLSAVIVALRVVGLDLAPSIAARMQDVVPRVLTSAVVLILGIPLAIAASRILNALLAPSGLRPNRIRSQAVTALLVGFVVLIALEQLGLAAQLVIAIGITVVAAAGLALALAFGLGCRDLARDLIIEYLRASEEGSPPRHP
ncbi:MAG TPA: hypothetical protein VGQ14_04420 [Candidatus Eisenbacteria bacterium]|jgi:hypothetical protein|nr:hypothetical protein [Candidatus Eisenbacteria bacterium]